MSEALTRSASGRNVSRAERARWKILVVDDDPEVHAVTRFVLGQTELLGRPLELIEAKSSRAKTLNALLSYAATPLKDFPAFPGDRTIGVRLYRFQRPDTWEGLVP